ncbi:probable serine racemase [Pollicipes pollicipes]|uniref:probable serine racemase n=1 Tax=Pollicipes pollicipes TaxID=41117 RepID=UPI00188530D5|nr:probable serine racemase [Pollicipes pollicipes]XP_037085128.1 probable serine racemase [Pollicipes pollicipes]XP_037085138.1 probable serine racemase [Pollicipes pollicipes]
MGTMSKVCLEDIRLAYQRIKLHVHRTPVITSQYFNEQSGRQLFFKAENLQKTGSFKARGACNCVLSIKERNPLVSGVVTHSSGNHGQATAYAARVAGLACTVVVPRGTSEVKADAIRSYGAELIYCEPTPLSRHETCAAVAAETRAAVVHPYDDYDTIAGQGTIALELLEQVPDLDAILVAVSGGGMISGIATAVNELRPECKVIAVEPDGKHLGPSLRAGRRLWLDPPRFISTLADGCTTQQCGRLTFPILCRLVEPTVLTVTDDQMAAATRRFWQRAKHVIEPSAGMVVAAALSDQLPAELRRVGVVLCGGNLDLDRLPWLSAGGAAPHALG